MSGTERPDRPALTPRTAILTVASIALAAALLLWLLPAVTGVAWSHLASTLATASPAGLVALPLLAGLALLAGAAGLRGAIEGLPMRRALPASAVTTALSVAVPGGATVAIGVLYGLCRRAGVTRPAILAGIAATTVADLATGLLLVPVGVVCLLASGARLGAGMTVLVVALAVVCALALIAGGLLLRRRTLSALLAGAEGGLGGLGLGSLSEGGRLSAGSVLAVRDAAATRLRRHWPAVLGAPVGVRLMQLVALFTALRAVGLSVPATQVMAVFALGRVLALVPLTPGGAGLAETGAAAALIALGTPAAPASAAAVLTTVTTLLAPVAFGLLAAPFAVSARRRPRE